MGNLAAYNTSTFSGSFDRGNINVAISSSIVSGSTGNTRFGQSPTPPSGGMVIISDSNTQLGIASASATPQFWIIDNLNDTASVLNTINALPERINQTRFVTTSSAYLYLVSSSKYFPILGTEPLNTPVTDGLTMYLDAGQLVSYPTTASTWYDISGNNNSGSLINGPTYNPNGYIVFDGVDDVVNLSSISQSNWSLTSKFQFNVQKTKTTQYAIFTVNSAGTRVGRSLLEFTYTATCVSMVVDPSGNIFLGGRITETNGTRRELIVKLNNSGSVITAFDAGLYITQTQDTTGLALDATGSLFYVGYNIGNLTKLNPTTGAQLQRISGSINASITQANVVLDEPNNKVYIGGWFTSIQGRAAQRFARLNLDTMGIDSTFDTTTGFVNAEDVQTIALQSDGKVLVGGQFTSYKGSTYNRIIRLNPDASIDTTFNIGTGFDNTVQRNCIVVQPDGKIIVGGSFTTYSGSAANRIVRLNTSGSIDTTFNTGVGFNSSVFDIKLQPDGKILAVGDFTSYSGSSSSRIIRLNPDGTRDTTFNVGSGVNSAPNVLYLQNDGKILVAGGYFTSYSGSTVNQVIRVTNSGSLDTSFSVGTGLLGAYRLNNQVVYRASNNVLTSQFFYRITTPTSYDWASFETASLPLLNKFSEYTLTKDNLNVYRQYWNGQLLNNVTQSTALDTGFDVNRIGTLNGEINTFNVYNKSLSQDEINQNYYGGPIVTNGLVFAADASNLVSYESGSTLTYSLTGSASGSLINGTGYSNVNGGSWVFDGIDDNIYFNMTGSTQNPYTFVIVFNTIGMTSSTTGENRKSIFGLQNAGNYTYRQFNLELWGATVRSYRGNGLNGAEGVDFFQYNTSATIPINTLNHVTVTVYPTGSQYYINGVLSGNVSSSSNLTASFDRIIVGSRNGGGANIMTGNCYYFSVYNRVLTSTEIQQNFNAQRQRFGI